MELNDMVLKRQAEMRKLRTDVKILREDLIMAKLFIAECWDYHVYSNPSNCSHCELLEQIQTMLETTGDGIVPGTDWDRIVREKAKRNLLSDTASFQYMKKYNLEGTTKEVS